eukprot:1268912-Amphidinium_carterae.1
MGLLPVSLSNTRMFLSDFYHKHRRRLGFQCAGRCAHHKICSNQPMVDSSDNSQQHAGKGFVAQLRRFGQSIPKRNLQG